MGDLEKDPCSSEIERAKNAAELDGFQKGLRKRDEQIRTGTLPDGIGPVPSIERLAGELEARAKARPDPTMGELAEGQADGLREAASFLRDSLTRGERE